MAVVESTANPLAIAIEHVDDAAGRNPLGRAARPFFEKSRDATSAAGSSSRTVGSAGFVASSTKLALDWRRPSELVFDYDNDRRLKIAK